jgi:hypothetical protein
LVSMRFRIGKPESIKTVGQWFQRIRRFLINVRLLPYIVVYWPFFTFLSKEIIQPVNLRVPLLSFRRKARNHGLLYPNRQLTTNHSGIRADYFHSVGSTHASRHYLAISASQLA